MRLSSVLYDMASALESRAAILSTWSPALSNNRRCCCAPLLPGSLSHATQSAISLGRSGLSVPPS
jgi:hypothetical protein